MKAESLFGAFGRVGHFAYRRRWRIVAAWIVALVVFGGLLSANFSKHTVAEDHIIGGSDSARAERLLAERFAIPVDETAVVTFDSTTLTADDAAFKAAVASTLARIGQRTSAEHVVGTVGPFSPGAGGQISVGRNGMPPETTPPPFGPVSATPPAR
jgi:uncharacterized membrane protein YdfJ with MMPL/SSD domain